MDKTTEISKKEETKPERSRPLPEIAPLVDIYENDNEILLHADMPGVAKEDVNINVDNNIKHVTNLTDPSVGQLVCT